MNEACSGVRSLQTSLMIGLLFGELKRLSLARRIALVAAAAAIAFVANCARTFFLVWIASRDGVGAVERWHDTAGYAILGAVFLGTIGVAAWLGGGAKEAAVVENRESNASAIRVPRFALALLPLLLLIEGAVESFGIARTREISSPRRRGPCIGRRTRPISAR